MKLIYLSHWRFPSDKTMSPLILRTCEELSQSGCDVELWVPRRINSQYPHADPFGHYHIKPSFTIKKLPVLDLIEYVPGTMSFMVMIFTFALSVWWYGKPLPEDVIWYAHDLRDVLFLRKKNIFLEIHDFYENKFRIINSAVFQKIRGFVVTNKIKMQHMEKTYGIGFNRMAHLPNAVDLVRFDRKETKEEARTILALPKDKRLIVYTGSIFEWKGIYTLALASQYLLPNADIIFAGGNNTERNKFQESIQKHNFSHIILLPLPYEDIERAPLLMRAADVLILPNTAKFEISRVETSPVKLFEYMASGTPIVASDLPSIRDVVDETMVNFFEADNPESLANSIREVLDGQKAAADRASVARAEIKQYSWEARIR